MFIENQTEYKNAKDYANKNPFLVWIGKEDNFTALNKWYHITTLPSGRIYVQAGTLTWYAPNVEDAKDECETDYQATYGVF